MTTRRLITLAALVGLLITSASAADITLGNGKTLQGARITAQSARFVTVFHTGGIVQVEKQLLPAELRAQYPIDAAAVKRDEEAQATAIRAKLAAEEARRKQAAAPAVAANGNPTPNSSLPVINPDPKSLAPDQTNPLGYYINSEGRRRPIDPPEYDSAGRQVTRGNGKITRVQTAK